MENMRDILRPKRDFELPISSSLNRATCGLFYEWRHSTTIGTPAPYTLKKCDIVRKGQAYKSAHLIYMSCATEYEAAMRLLGSWEHWVRLVSTKWFPAYLEDWREEVRMRDDAIAKKVLYEQVELGDSRAAKALLAMSQSHEPPKQANPVGRPKKGRSELAEAREEVQDDVLDQMLSGTGDEHERVV